MDLIILILILAAIGGLTYLVTTRVPMDRYFAMTIQVLVLVLVVIYVLTRFVPLPNLLTR